MGVFILSKGVGRPRWTVWGQGDLQTFQGAGTEHEGDGDLRTGYLGLDARLGEKWLLGAAVARSGGVGDWRVGSSSGRMTTALTVVHPYLRWGGRDTSVWALAGIGLGTAENVRMLTDTRGTSPLHLGLGLVEGRRRLGDHGPGAVGGPARRGVMGALADRRRGGDGRPTGGGGAACADRGRGDAGAGRSGRRAGGAVRRGEHTTVGRVRPAWDWNWRAVCG